jgi:glycosyltransferase involved in cell wall biosynthesis
VARIKLLFIVNVDWFFVSHRLSIAVDAVKKGYEVHIATTVTDKIDLLESSGIVVHPLALHRSRSGVVVVFKEFLEILSLLRKVTPDIVHLVTIKPMLLGGIAARMASVPAVVSAVSGLGFVFVTSGVIARLRRKVISLIYRLALGHHNQKVIFQNVDDQSKLSKLAALSTDRSVLIHGSGVDLSLYHRQPLPEGVPTVLLAARLLVDKGVREFVRAAGLVNRRERQANFVLVGEVDPLNPASIQQSQLDSWKEDGIVECWGYRDDMEQVLSSATIVVLPSYREGFPKVLIEAAACGRAVVTTDVPGCRDAIEDGVTGLLVPVRNAEAIANAVLILLGDQQRCKEMGRAGRERAEEMFDVKQVVAEHMEVYDGLAGSGLQV